MQVGGSTGLACLRGHEESSWHLSSDGRVSMAQCPVGDHSCCESSRIRVAIFYRFSRAGPRSSIILDSKNLGEDPSWICLFYVGWSLAHACAGPKAWHLAGLPNRGGRGHRGAACVGFIIVVSLHRCTHCKIIACVALIARIAGPRGYRANMKRCNDALPWPPTAGGGTHLFLAKLAFFIPLQVMGPGVGASTQVGQRVGSFGQPGWLSARAPTRWQQVATVDTDSNHLLAIF